MSEVDRIYEELVSLRAIVAGANSPSDISNLDTLAKKSLLLAAASYFEKQICDAIIETLSAGSVSPILGEFIRRQALLRKYHTMFDWNSSNLNTFFGLFGDEAKASLVEAAKMDNQTENIRQFIYINSERNRLVHNNFASYSLDVLFREVWEKFTGAQEFTNRFTRCLAKMRAVDT